MWAKILRFSASHSSTAWLLAIGLTFATGAIWYVQQLRVKAARCEASQEIMGRYERLADRLERELSDELERDEKALRDAVHPCLDVRTDELLRDPLDAGGVPRDPAGQ